MDLEKNHVIFNERHSGLLALNYESIYPSFYDGENCVVQFRELLSDEIFLQELKTLFVVTIIEHHGNFNKIIDTILKNKLNLSKLGIGAVVYPDYEKGDYVPDDRNMDGSSWNLRIPNLFPLIESLPNLEELVIQANTLYSGGNYLNHSKLRSLILRTGSTAPEFFYAFGRAYLPNLTHLEITLGDYSYGWGESANIFEDLFNNKNFNSLEHFTCKCDFVNDIIIKLKDSSILKQIKIIDISDSNFNDEGAEFILANWNSFEHLKLLDLSNNCISSDLSLKLEEKTEAIQIGYQRYNTKKENITDIRKTLIF